MQDAEILSIRRRRIARDQGIVGLTEATRWEEFLTKSITRKRSRLTHQPVDDVTIFNVALVSSAQPGHVLHQLLGKPHFHVLHVQPDINLLTD
jgi:hypothetical protein